MFKLMLILLSLFVFVGCDNGEVEIDETLPVAVHFAIEDGLAGNEWQNFIMITVNSDDIVTALELNGIPQLANMLRSEVAQLDDYADVFGYNFYEQADYLERHLIGTSSDELVEIIRDAYDNNLVDFDTTAFADLASRALASPPVEKGPYIDGTYRGMDVINEDGLQYFVNLFVINGDIVAVHYNAINHNDDGFLKYAPLFALTVDHEVTNWRDQAQLLEQALIRFQDPMGFTFDDDGFSTDIPGVDFEIESFVSLVTKALAAGPIILEVTE